MGVLNTKTKICHKQGPSRAAKSARRATSSEFVELELEVAAGQLDSHLATCGTLKD